MVSKKDFELVAAVVRRRLKAIDPHAYYGDVNVNLLSLEKSVDILSEAFSNTNPRFDRDRFRKACGLP